MGPVAVGGLTQSKVAGDAQWQVGSQDRHPPVLTFRSVGEVRFARQADDLVVTEAVDDVDGSRGTDPADRQVAPPGHLRLDQFDDQAVVYGELAFMHGHLAIVRSRQGSAENGIQPGFGRRTGPADGHDLRPGDAVGRP